MGPFLLDTFFISLSGVMAPGPLTATAVAEGSGSPHAGALVALGHGIVELPLMLAIFWGLGEVLRGDRVGAAIGLAGGLFLLLLGAAMLRRPAAARGTDPGPSSPVLAGVLLSAGNPYFLVWWATVGASLVSRALGFGWPGFLAFAALHWSCDLGWLYLLSRLAFRGSRLLGPGFARAVRLACGAFLLSFGGKFIADALRTLL